MTTTDEEMKTRIDPRWLVLFAIAVHVLMFAVRTSDLNIWADEASALYTTQNGLVEAIARVFHDEKQAPLYFVLLSLWRTIAPSILAARVFSVLFSAAAIWVFYLVARRLLSDAAAAIATVFFGFHPFLLWTSLEIRGYSMVVLLACVLLKLFQDGYLDDDRRARLLYLAAAVVALYTNYYLGFLLVGNFAALLFVRPKLARQYLASMTAVAILIAPLVWMIATQLIRSTNDVPTPRVPLEGARLIWSSVNSFLLPTELFPGEDPTTMSTIRLWLVRLAVVAGIALAVRNRRQLTRETAGAFACVAVVAAFLLVVYFALGEIYVEIRHAAVLFPALIIFVVLFVRDVSANLVPRTARRLLVYFACGPMMMFLVYSTSMLYPGGAKRGDWARVANFIRTHEAPGQPIVVFTAFDALCLPYYYDGPNKIVPDERFFNWGADAAFGTPESLRSETEFVISEIPAGATEIWLATGERCQATKACELLENYVRANYTIEWDMPFYKERLRLLRKREQ